MLYCTCSDSLLIVCNFYILYVFPLLQPKNSIYAKRANLKARSEKLHKRKTSESDPAEDGGMTAESSLLMQQILDEEKVYIVGKICFGTMLCEIYGIYYMYILYSI